ncbi:MAG: heat-inducible transcription repressor HrcA [Clostridia bacterium]|nr:heat-inducible transcription repressor HrcA [Clostridia bacterium]
MFGNELSERKRLILKAIVEAHIEGGDPVGSKYLMENRNITCSSATIRNEMAELESLGYLEQPHTSAGRVPSELGYRFYVDSLAQEYAMTAREIEEINKLLKMKMTEIDQILVMASKVASAITNYTGIAIKPRRSNVTIERFEGFAIDSRSFVLVMMLSNGSVKTRNVRVDNGISTETIGRLTTLLNSYVSGLTTDGITLPIIMDLEREMGGDGELISPIIKSIYEVMNEIDSGELKLSGLDRLLQYPEYADTDRFREMLGALEKKDEILNLVSEAKDDDINVIIGSESAVKVMDHSALVFKPIVKNGKTLGAIGVIGPLRMDYAKVLATIAGLSGRLADLINENSLTDGEDKNGRKGI